MPRFAFGKRKSVVEGDGDAAAPPSFRVLDRSEVVDGNGRSFDGGVRLSAKTNTLPRTTVTDVPYDDNIFGELKHNTNRGSGSSNTTKTNSTDNSSRHSNASTTPSSADLNAHEDWRLSSNRKSLTENLAQPTPRPTSFLKSGRSWSFGGSKKHLSAASTEEHVPETPAVPEQYQTGRARATTSSTDATVTPALSQDFGLDLGGSFSKMFSGFDKRSSAMALRDDNGKQVLQPTAMTGGRVNAPSPIQIDNSSKVEPPQHSWASHRSHEELLSTNENTPPPVPKHGDTLPTTRRAPRSRSSENLLKRTSAMFGGRRKQESPPDPDPDTSEGDDLDASLLAVNRFMSDANSRSTTPVGAVSGRYKTDENFGPGYTVVPPKSPASQFDLADEDDNLFDNVPLNTSRLTTPRQPPRKPTAGGPAQSKVMTPSEFEKYRKDKEVESKRAEIDRIRENLPANEDDEEDVYEDEEDELEKSRQVAKQRRKQEAHMSVYRQQMMKVTGESAEGPPARPAMSMSFSTPNLSVPESSRNPSSDGEGEDDEEVPLAILAAHGFPNKNRPPTRLSTMMSNPNLRQASQPSYQRPGSAAGHVQTASGSLPPFARGLPQDPYGLVNSTVRESFSLGGGVPAGQTPPPPPGGLVGVIANEERARSLRRGSPQVSQMEGYQGQPGMGPGGFDPVQGIPPHMMYPQAMAMQNMMMTPGEQAQVQLSQQMSQFMQMQMQFMQMMAANNNQLAAEAPRPAGHINSQSMPGMPGMPGMNGMGMNGTGMDMNPGARSSYLELPAMGSDMHGRTMSMVQPSSASWLQPPPVSNGGYAGSIRGQGYAPSIAPSERSNVGLPGRYRPVSHMPSASTTTPEPNRKSYMSGGVSSVGESHSIRVVEKSPPRGSSRGASATQEPDDDDDEGWAAMKAKRDQKKKSAWRLKKSLASSGDLDIGSLIT